MNKLILFLLIAFLTGCSKGDSTPPLITVTSPVNNQVFISGQSVTVKADIEDEDGLHMVHLIVTDNAGGHIVHFEEHYEGRTYQMIKSFSVQSGKTYNIEVGATDHNENKGTKTLTVSAN